MVKFLSKKNKKRLELFGSQRVRDELDKRYQQCDSEGHQGPVIDNICSYCHRHETYEISAHLKSEMDRRDEENSKKSVMDIPCEAPIWYDKMRDDLASQKFEDKQTRLTEIAKELYPNEFPSQSQ